MYLKIFIAYINAKVVLTIIYNNLSKEVDFVEWLYQNQNIIIIMYY